MYKNDNYYNGYYEDHYGINKPYEQNVFNLGALKTQMSQNVYSQTSSKPAITKKDWDSLVNFTDFICKVLEIDMTFDKFKDLSDDKIKSLIRENKLKRLIEDENVKA